MASFRKILVVLDPERGGPAALDRAGRLARRDGGALRLFAAIEPVPWYTRLMQSASASLQEGLVRACGDRLEALAAPLRAEGLTVETDLALGRASLEATRVAIRDGFDLLIKEAKAPPEGSGPGHPGTTDMRLLRNCPCPVWLLMPGAPARFARVLAAVNPRPEAPPEGIDPLGLADDPSRPEIDRENALNREIVARAAAIAVEDGTALHLAHAWHLPCEEMLRGSHGVSDDEVDAFVAATREGARALLGRLATGIERPTGGMALHLVEGRPGRVIPELIERDHIDLVVMGTVARTGIAGFVIGNTAETVLGRVSCSVLAIKPEGFVSPIDAEG